VASAAEIGEVAGVATPLHRSAVALRVGAGFGADAGALAFGLLAVVRAFAGAVELENTD
jgi:hypothetical protein